MQEFSGRDTNYLEHIGSHKQSLVYLVCIVCLLSQFFHNYVSPKVTTREEVSRRKLGGELEVSRR